MTVHVPAVVRWILFDAVGTLIYADPPVAQVYRDAGCRAGFEASIEQIKSRFRQALAAEFGPPDDLTRPPTSESHELARWQRIVAAVHPEVGPLSAELFESLWQHFAQPTSWRLFADVQPALQHLQQCGLKLGIASNFDSRLQEIVLETPELAACEWTFVSSKIGFSKPDPRFFASVAAQLNATPREILLVGDDWQADVQGARAAGWQAIWLNRHADLESNEPAISSLLELTRC